MGGLCKANIRTKEKTLMRFLLNRSGKLVIIFEVWRKRLDFFFQLWKLRNKFLVISSRL